MLIFDVGGTFIKYAIVENGSIIYKNKISTPDGSLIASRLIEVANEISNQYQVTEIGISSAGQIDSKRGKVIFAGPTIPNYTGAELKQVIESATKLPVTVLNDVEACIYNYADTADLLYISLGTGIGGAYKTDGRVLRGENGIALEIGHIYHPAGDSFENICSTRSLINNYYELTGEQISGEQFDNLVVSGDQQAIALKHQFFKDIALGLINLKYILDFNTVIIGGGITEARFFTADELESQIKQINANTDLSKLQVQISSLGNDASLLGVYNYIIEEQNEI